MNQPTNPYIRDYIGDNGNTPTVGGASTCPDIVLKFNPFQDPVSEFGNSNIINTENTILEWEQNIKSYLYFRVLNPTNQSGTVTGHLFYAVSGAYQPQTAWMKNKIAEQTIKLDPGTIQNPSVGIPDTVPTWIPKLSGHLCFICYITSDDWNIQKPDVSNWTGIADYCKYIHDNNTMAFCNHSKVDIYGCSTNFQNTVHLDDESYQTKFTITSTLPDGAESKGAMINVDLNGKHSTPFAAKEKIEYKVSIPSKQTAGTSELPLNITVQLPNGFDNKNLKVVISMYVYHPTQNIYLYAGTQTFLGIPGKP